MSAKLHFVSSLRRNDGKEEYLTFYDLIKFVLGAFPQMQ